MIAVEGEKRRELHPAVAELFISVAIEAACVDSELCVWDQFLILRLDRKRTYHGYTKERKAERLWDGKEHVVPF